MIDNTRMLFTLVIAYGIEDFGMVNGHDRFLNDLMSQCFS